MRYVQTITRTWFRPIRRFPTAERLEVRAALTVDVGVAATLVDDSVLPGQEVTYLVSVTNEDTERVTVELDQSNIDLHELAWVKTTKFPADGIDLPPAEGDGFTIAGTFPEHVVGATVSTGDINGDGFADILVGAPGEGSSAGEVYVVFGSAQRLSGRLSASDLDGERGFVIGGFATGSNAGRALSGAGDINGDGLDDVVIGSPEAGEAYVVFGRQSGFPASLDINSLDGTTGFAVGADGLHDVSRAGDVNGDGFADLLIGTRLSTDSPETAAYVVFGHSGPWDEYFEAFSVNGFAVHRAANRPVGRCVSDVGDVNGDGFDDIFAESVIFGAAQMPAVVEISSLDGANGFSVAEGGRFIDTLRDFVSGVGDVNADGQFFRGHSARRGSFFGDTAHAGQFLREHSPRGLE